MNMYEKLRERNLDEQFMNLRYTLSLNKLVDPGYLVLEGKMDEAIEKARELWQTQHGLIQNGSRALVTDTYYPVGEYSVLYLEEVEEGENMVGHLLICDAGYEPEEELYIKIEY